MEDNENFYSYTKRVEKKYDGLDSILLGYLNKKMTFSCREKRLLVNFDFGKEFVPFSISYEELDDILECLRLSKGNYYNKPIMVNDIHFYKFLTHFEIARTHRKGVGLEGDNAWHIELFISHLYNKKIKLGKKNKLIQ